MVTPTESAQTAEADGLTGGAIAGIVVGVAVAMIAVIGLAAFFVFKKPIKLPGSGAPVEMMPAVGASPAMKADAVKEDKV